MLGVCWAKKIDKIFVLFVFISEIGEQIFSHIVFVCPYFGIKVMLTS